MQKNISKTMYLEWVIRNSLYWMSNIARWKLDEDDDHWFVSFEHWNDEVEFEFERLLNDYKLREKLQAHTCQIRTSVIDNVLRSIDSRLAGFHSFVDNEELNLLANNIFPPEQNISRQLESRLFISDDVTKAVSKASLSSAFAKRLMNELAVRPIFMIVPTLRCDHTCFQAPCMGKL